MPTNRTRRTRGRRPDVQSWQTEFLMHGALSPETEPDANPFELLNWQNPDRHQLREIKRVWRACESAIMVPWIRQHPGTRPHGWWLFNAPEPCRLRLDGVGTPAHEVLCIKQVYLLGLPTVWLTPFLAAYYKGTACDIHGQPVPCTVADPQFPGVAPDPADPPRYESQASFLDRHGLLTAAERKRLSAADFEPETIQPPER